MAGARVGDYLQGQITQDVACLPECGLLYAALLTPQGKAVCDLWLARDGEACLLIVPTLALEAALARLRQFSIGFVLSIEARDDLALWSLQGKGSRALAEGMTMAWPCAEADDDGVWIVAERQPDLGVPLVAEEKMEAARIVHGTPRFGIDWEGFPLNAGLIERDGVSFDKGCFVGQEVTSRMRWRGGIRKRICHLALARLPETLPAEVRTTVPVGRVTSAAIDGDGRVFGIAQLPVDLLESGVTLRLADGSEVVPTTNSGMAGA